MITTDLMRCLCEHIMGVLNDYRPEVSIGQDLKYDVYKWIMSLGSNALERNVDMDIYSFYFGTCHFTYSPDNDKDGFSVGNIHINTEDFLNKRY